MVVGGQSFNVWTTIWDVRAQWKYRGFHTRGLFTMSHVGDAGALTANNCGTTPTGTTSCQVAETMLGGYVEAAYDVMPHILSDTRMRLEPFYRWEISDTQNTMPTGVAAYEYANFQTHIVGLQYYPHPQVVIKTNYRNIHAQGRDSEGRQRSDDFEFGVGFIF